MGKKKSKYGEYSKETQQFMAAVETFIKKKYGDIEDHWRGQLTLLATNYELFILARKSIMEEGIIVQNRFGGMDKNPLLRVVTDANIQCIKLISEFGLSPKASSKIKETENDGAELIHNLLKG